MYAGAVVGRYAFGQIGTIHNSRTGQPFPFSECSILNIRNGTFLRVPRESVWFILEVPHEQVESGAVPTPDWDAEELGAALDAQSLPPGSERTEALKKADLSCLDQVVGRCGDQIAAAIAH